MNPSPSYPDGIALDQLDSLSYTHPPHHPTILYSPSLSRSSSQASLTLDRLAQMKAARLSDESLKKRKSSGEVRRGMNGEGGGQGRGKGARFWLVFVALCCSCFLSALDLTAVSTALPSIAAEFESGEYSWVGSAYALTSTALIPWTGGLAFIFGRRPILLTSLAIFALGSALTGAGKSMSMVIAGRAIQGVGGGAVLTMTEIVVVDLVPIAERGAYLGILASVWAFASAIGPPIGGALASASAWRWLFYLNLPLSGLAMILVALFLNVRSPKTTRKEKLEQMDFVNILFVCASTATILALTWGGVSYPWSSFRVLVPLVLGLVGMVAFVFLEKSFVKVPTVPFEILASRTSLMGYLTTFLHGILVMCGVYFIPAYFQACFGDSPIQSGIHLFSLSFTVAPLAILTGISVTVLGHYRWQNIVGWMLITLSFGCMTLLKFDSPKTVWVPITVFLGSAAGILFSATNFAVLAPVKPAQQPHGMAFYGFVRSFGQVVGIAAGGTVLQNRLTATLPVAFAEKFGESSEIAFAAIPHIKDLPDPIRTLVRVSFADSLRLLWQICIAIAGVGLVLSFFIESIPLATVGDEENWGLEKRERSKSAGSEEKMVGGGEVLSA
ncbi:hypothetical protein JCM8547_006690 [Rhodosporidiobolus lusitaniae]